MVQENREGCAAHGRAGLALRYVITEEETSAASEKGEMTDDVFLLVGYRDLGSGNIRVAVKSAERDEYK
ncbi:hypothetical protein EBH_0045470 [Eimeria brunetti]|uniref:Uncharacterized protein n=1 Tax=Eimeria brunetti TaxID=51314 RepID=U6LRM1_9EIME|nr:hypothetical protein EBH_0045470 [Eimeria brunetti]